MSKKCYDKIIKYMEGVLEIKNIKIDDENI